MCFTAFLRHPLLPEGGPRYSLVWKLVWCLPAVLPAVSDARERRQRCNSIPETSCGGQQ